MLVLMNEQAPNRNFDDTADKPRCAFLFAARQGEEKGSGVFNLVEINGVGVD